MEQWIAFAKGPLFAGAFLVMVLGLARIVVIQVYSLAASKGSRLKQVAWRKMLAETASWAAPLGHLIPGTKMFFRRILPFSYRYPRGARPSGRPCGAVGTVPELPSAQDSVMVSRIF